MKNDHSLTVYTDNDMSPDPKDWRYYVIKKDGTYQYFNDLFTAVEGLVEEYPLENEGVE